jgi:hypothetical protein
MNHHLMEILGREIIKSLPAEKREMYEYVVQKEDELAQWATTSEEFLALLVKHAPHRQAARHFNLTFGELMMTMREIEEEINQQLESKLKNVQWVDLTKTVRGRIGNFDENCKFYYFSVNQVHS